jgi:hypothetical protein
MVTTERPTVVIGVAAKWAVDAALFFVMSAGFLVWGLIARSASVNILTFAIMATLALLFDRLRPLLPGAAALGAGHDRPPDHAVRRTWPRYTLEATGVMAVASVVEALIIVVALSAQPGFVGGWMVAYCVSRLRALTAARAIERTSGIRLSMRLQRSVWRTRAPAFYATPRLV